MYSVKIITVDQSRYLENRANKGGLSFSEMMENAGRETAHAIHHRLGTRDRRVVVLVGPGNNGGDGLVAAHYLKEMGARVTCYVWKRKVEDDENYRRVEEDGIFVVWASEDGGFDALRALLSTADVIVDALLGVGVTRPIGGTLEEILDVVRRARVRHCGLAGLIEPIPYAAARSCPSIVAVDCPTGLDCDTGALDPATLSADVTVTFAYPKVGLLRFPGAEAVGDLIVADIAIPPELADDVPLELATAELVRTWLPKRPASAHKGTFGRALIVAGSVNYVGAATLAGAGATRVGTGLVTLGLPMPIQPAVAASLTEATYLLLPHDMGVISSGAVDVLREKMGDYQALLLGPGLTQEKETMAFVQDLLGLERADRKGRIGFLSSSAEAGQRQPSLPSLVVDADGLNALASVAEWWKALPADTVLTPHPGEMARLVGGDLAHQSASVQEIQADREGVAQRMAARWNAVVVLKGAFTVVAAPDDRVVVSPFANPGLATAGSGDVLAGAIVGLRAQGMGAFEAAVAGTYLHGLAGQLVREDLGDMGMVAGDLAPRLPLALQKLRRGG